jgi:hypothetical protein
MKSCDPFCVELLEGRKMQSAALGLLDVLCTPLTLLYQGTDTTGDNVVDAGDCTIRLFGEPAVAYLVIVTPVIWRGDANEDGRVNIFDYFLLDRDRAMEGEGHQEGDVNWSGDVDADDYAVVDRDYLNRLFGGSTIGGGGEIIELAAPKCTLSASATDGTKYVKIPANSAVGTVNVIAKDSTGKRINPTPKVRLSGRNLAAFGISLTGQGNNGNGVNVVTFSFPAQARPGPHTLILSANQCTSSGFFGQAA